MDFPLRRWISPTLCSVNSGTVIAPCPTKGENLGQGELKGGMWIRGFNTQPVSGFPTITPRQRPRGGYRAKARYSCAYRVRGSKLAEKGQLQQRTPIIFLVACDCQDGHAE